jgi:hypothetical protein
MGIMIFLLSILRDCREQIADQESGEPEARGSRDFIQILDKTSRPWTPQPLGHLAAVNGISLAFASPVS